MTKRLFIIMVTVSLLGCKREETNKIEVLQKNSVDTLIVGSSSFILDACLWRDFMPVCPPDGEPMISINWLISTNLAKIPDNISMVKQYVFYDNEIWISDYENEAPTPSLPEHKMERISRNGPKWGPNIYVDVISQIHNSQNNEDYYIQRKNVYVSRTD